ncbi:MAG: hypothetical protein JWQ09_4244 [Segetibacter sp.]|nr:hypothetical protein [Segetibacter sp.]
MPNEPFTEISFYIVAHADDWQLFMQPNVYNDLVASGSKVVYIITTAGDAGAGETYWAAREEGSKSSLRFCLAPLATISQSSGKREFNYHTVNYWSANNATTYFLRLPDGNLDGNGFSANDYKSLSKLKAGKISTITSIDNSTTYHSWSDFYTTLQTIIVSESQGISNIWINYLNPDTSINPNDHPDHIATGQAIQAMTIIPGLRQALFVGYKVSNAPENLHPTDLFWKAGMFAAYEKAVFDSSGYSTLHENIHTYVGWCLSSANFIIANP